jgi:hypothetical protein
MRRSVSGRHLVSRVKEAGIEGCRTLYSGGWCEMPELLRLVACQAVKGRCAVCSSQGSEQQRCFNCTAHKRCSAWAQ